MTAADSTTERFERRVMPGPMFSGKWQVEERRVFYSPRRGGWDRSPWYCVDDNLYDSKAEAQGASALTLGATRPQPSPTPTRSPNPMPDITDDPNSLAYHIARSVPHDDYTVLGNVIMLTYGEETMVCECVPFEDVRVSVKTPGPLGEWRTGNFNETDSVSRMWAR